MVTPLSTTRRLMTYEELVALPSTRDHDRTELIAGEPIVSPSPGRKHQRCVYLLSRVVGDAVEAANFGQLFFAPMDVRLAPMTVLQPDLLVLRHELLATNAPEGIIDGPPDLVIEVISPFSRTRDEVTKRAIYEQAGVAEYWLVDPERKRVTLLSLTDKGYQEIAPGRSGVVSALIPGLIIDPTALFAGL